MTLKPTSIDEITTAYRANFLGGLTSATPIWSQIATLVSSSTKIESYPFLHSWPMLKEWIGARKFEELKASDYQLTNRKFSAAVRVPRDDLDDDRVGLWSPQMTMMGESAAYWPDDLVTTALINGGTATCYDGVAFFHGSHPVDPYNSAAGTQSNLYTSKALTEANFAAVRAGMMTLKDASGKVLRIMPDLLIVPAALEATARKIVQGEYISQASGSTQTNVLRGMANVLVIPQLDASSTTTWYMASTARAVKPFIFQQREAPDFTRLTDSNSEYVMTHDEYVFASRARGAAGYGMWQLAAKCTA